MNEQHSKKLIFNKSTLWSLKAELLKKQEEVHEKKQLPQHKLENFKPAPSKPESTEKGLRSDKKSFKDSLKAVDTEELEACRKSKAILEKKAELYNHLSDGAGNSQLAGQFLVDFNTKKQEETQNREPSPRKVDLETSIDEEDDSDWTEFTDCLGRTRKCLKSDVDHYMKRDRELMKVINKDVVKQDAENNENEIEVPKPETPLLVQKTNDYLQSLREKWEQREQELLAKDNDIHYQDLLFDEARMHGVAYYSFSTDEKERHKQMVELKRQREETLRAQQQAEEMRQRQDELMSARVAAARARMRARAGLPPEETQEVKKDFTTCLLEFLTTQRDEADEKAKAEDKKIREEQEKERQKLRETYVREWDMGKDGVEGTGKKFREMTQEEYEEQQRSKRLEEFAPPQTATSQRSNNFFDDGGKMVETHTPNKSWADVRPKPKTPPPPDISDVVEQKGLYFSTVKNPQPKNQILYKNFVKSQEPTPIINELDNNEDRSYASSPEKRKLEWDHVEIAPPPTYDYYGPVPKHSKTQQPFTSDIREAYAQGAQSLEPKASKLQLSQHYDFTFD